LVLGHGWDPADRQQAHKRTVWEVNRSRFRRPTSRRSRGAHQAVHSGGVSCRRIVFDPFVGSGTTVLVARSLECHAIGLDLSKAYLAIAKRRLAQEVLEFSEALRSP